MARAAIPATENDILQSATMATAPWGSGPGVVVTNNTTDVADPNGTSTASKLVYDGSSSAGNFILFQATKASPGGERNTSGVWMRLSSGSANIRLTDNVGLPLFDTVALNSTAWTLVSHSVVSVTPGTAVQPTFYRDAADNAARTFYLAFAQVALGKNRLGPYATTVAVSIPGPIRNSVVGRVPVSGRVPKSGRTTP